MNRHFETLIDRSRWCGGCGTLLAVGWLALVFIGLGPAQTLKAAASPSLTMQLVAVQPVASALSHDTPAQAPSAIEAVPTKPNTAPPPAAVQTQAPPNPNIAKKKDKPVPEGSPRQQRLLRDTSKKADPVTSAAASASTPSLTSGAISSEAAHTAKEQASLLARVMTQFEKYKRYPQAARKLGMEGVVRIQVRVNAQGTIVHIQLLDSNAHAMLCKSAMESMCKVQELWTAQPLEREAVLEIAVRYTLGKH